MTSQRHRDSAVRTSNRALLYALELRAKHLERSRAESSGIRALRRVALAVARSALIMTYDHSTGHYSLEKSALESSARS